MMRAVPQWRAAGHLLPLCGCRFCQSSMPNPESYTSPAQYGLSGWICILYASMEVLHAGLCECNCLINISSIIGPQLAPDAQGPPYSAAAKRTRRPRVPNGHAGWRYALEYGTCDQVRLPPKKRRRRPPGCPGPPCAGEDRARWDPQRRATQGRISPPRAFGP